MTNQEKKDAIQHLEKEIFMIEMKDQLDNADRSLIESLKKEIEELKNDRK